MFLDFLEIYEEARMKTQDAIAHFGVDRGARSRLAEALGISPGAVSQWGETVPEGQAYKLQVITKGALMVDPGLYSRAKARTAA